MYEKESIERKFSCVEWSFKLTDINLTVEHNSGFKWKSNAIYEFSKSRYQKLKDGILKNSSNMAYLYIEILIIGWHTERYKRGSLEKQGQ